MWINRTPIYPSIYPSPVVVVENFLPLYSKRNRQSETEERVIFMNHALWQSVLGEIELTISHAAFTTWFKNTELLDVADDTVTIAVPNIFAKRQFEVKFNDQIKTVLEKNGVNPSRVTYTVQTTGKKTVSRE